jgi:putative flippase GtrA
LAARSRARVSLTVVSKPGPPKVRRSAQPDQPAKSDQAALGARFNAVTSAIVGRLPFGLADVVAPNVLGFAIINSVTFGVDLGCLTALHGGLRWPVPLAITVSYIAAFALSYALNRALNFRSHGELGPQIRVYLAVVIVNYLAWILGVGSGLAALGVDYRAARIAAGAGEAVYMYAAMRWLVFRDR